MTWLDNDGRVFTKVGAEGVRCSRICFSRKPEGGFANAGEVSGVNGRKHVCLHDESPLITGRRKFGVLNDRYLLSDKRTCLAAEESEKK